MHNQGPDSAPETTRTNFENWDRQLIALRDALPAVEDDDVMRAQDVWHMAERTDMSDKSVLECYHCYLELKLVCEARSIILPHMPHRRACVRQEAYKGIEGQLKAATEAAALVHKLLEPISILVS